MGVVDIAEQQHGVSLSDTHDSDDTADTEGTTTSIDALNADALTAQPSVAFTVGGTRYVLDTQTLILYGVILADALLLYIALGG